LIRIVRQAQIFTATALLISASPLSGQSNSAPTPATANTGTAAIVGVVVDSLHGRYLSGAEVVVEGAKTMLQTTDSLGKFRLDSLTPGTYQVGVFHPVLDTLDLTLLTAPFHVGPDSASIVVLAVPSAATMIRRECPTRTGPPNGSAIVGHVSDPETLKAVAGAEVSLSWTELEVSKAFGIRQTPHLVRDTTDSTGAFRICGLPAALSASIQARRGAQVTPEIPIEAGDRLPQLVARTLSLSSVDSGAKVGKATVSGVVTLEGSATNAGTRVELAGTDIVAMTNEKGEFTMINLPSGSSVLLARHLGFAAETVPVELSSRQPQRVTIKLAKFVAMMDPVLVTARRQAALDKVGFTQRMKSGMGYYIGPEKLQRMHPIFVADIFRQVPGIRVIYGPDGETLSSTRGVGNGCVQYWVDDLPWMTVEPGDLNHFVTGGEVVAVEVYQDTSTPARYVRGGGSCTTIVLWTRFKIRS
jgi:hypothetical protein